MDFTRTSDLRLLEHMRLDDNEAFRELFDRHWEPLYTFAAKRLKSDADAKDLVQDLFIKLWIRRYNLSVETTVTSYLMSSLHYEVLSKISRSLKDEKKRELLSQAILSEFTEWLSPLQVKELLTLVEAEVNKLPPKMQQVYRLNQENDLSVKEIARDLYLSEQTVRNQLNSAFTRLRHSLKDAAFSLLFL